MSTSSPMASPKTAKEIMDERARRRSSIGKPILIEMEGQLLKKGNKRWFVLTSDTHILFWFKKQLKAIEESEYKKKCNGCFQLSASCNVEPAPDKKHKFQFKVTTSDKVDYFLNAASEEEMNAWMKCVRAAIESRGEGNKIVQRNSVNFTANSTKPIYDLSRTDSSTNVSVAVFEKQGYLTDKNKKRYFYRLKKDQLLWFEDEKEAKFLGSIPMLGATVEITSAVTFVLTSGEYSNELLAKSIDDARDWNAHLLNAITEVKKTPLYNHTQEKSWKIRVELASEDSGEVFGMVFQSTDNAEKIKEQFVRKIKEEQPRLFADIFTVDAFLLRIKGTNFFIMEELVPLYKIHLFSVCRNAFAVPKLELVSKLKLREQGINLLSLLQNNDKGLNLDAERLQQRELDTLIGAEFLNILAVKHSERDNEVNSFRRNMAKFRLETFDEIKDKLPEYLESEPLPKHIPSSVNIICNLPGDKHKTLTIDIKQTVAEVKASIFDKFKKIDVVKTVDKSVNDYILKVTGFRSYFVTMDKPFIAYDYIRTCLNKGEQINLSMIDFDQKLIIQKEKPPLIDQILAADEPDDLFTKDELHDREKPKISLRQKETLFTLRINQVSNIKIEGVNDAVTEGVSYVSVELFHGDTPIDDSIQTRAVPYKHYTTLSEVDKNSVSWNQTVACTVPLCNLPKAARVALTVWVKFNTEENPRPVGWANYQLIDHRSRLVTGPRYLQLWPGKANPIGTCVANLADKNPTIMSIEFEKQDKEVFFPELTPADEGEVKSRARSANLKKELEPLVIKDSLARLSKDDYSLIWEFREEIKSVPQALPKFLLAVKWNNPEQVREAYRLLPKWAALTPVQALELLDAKYADAKVREYAIKILSQLNDGDLSDYLLQLTQVLKYEPNHDSALARFLLQRALNSKDIVGHTFFWSLKAEMHVPEIRERYGLLLEAYLRGCAAIYRGGLFKQNDIVDQLTSVALKIKTVKKEERLETVRFLLRQIDFPDRFQLPLFTNVECKGLIIEKCKVMTSKKLPLWLVFENADRNGEKITVMFKCGDDLRQDVLTLQMIRLMDKLWTREDLQLRLKPYGVIATGDEIGMLQPVLDSETTASINREAGGAGSVLVKDTLSKWLRQQNPSEDEYKVAVETFALSCAGYCVATYVIGIGDRHNDNIMLHKKGNLFHIDFGHFLGHFKKKFGFEREKAPFVFTPQYAHVLGGKGSPMYQLFEETCSKAYNVIRNNSTLFINLFSMMLSIGLAELQSVDNIMFLRDQLTLDMRDEAAAAYFKNLIEESLTTKTTQFMDMVHILAN